MRYTIGMETVVARGARARRRAGRDRRARAPRRAPRRVATRSATRPVDLDAEDHRRSDEATTRDRAREVVAAARRDREHASRRRARRARCAAGARPGARSPRSRTSTGTADRARAAWSRRSRAPPTASPLPRPRARTARAAAGTRAARGCARSTSRRLARATAAHRRRRCRSCRRGTARSLPGAMLKRTRPPPALAVAIDGGATGSCIDLGEEPQRDVADLDERALAGSGARPCTRAPSTNVPLRLPRSRTCQPASVLRSSACSRDTELASMTSSPSWLRPTARLRRRARARRRSRRRPRPRPRSVSTFERR